MVRLVKTNRLKHFGLGRGRPRHAATQAFALIFGMRDAKWSRLIPDAICAYEPCVRPAPFGWPKAAPWNYRASQTESEI